MSPNRLLLPRQRQPHRNLSPRASGAVSPFRCSRCSSHSPSSSWRPRVAGTRGLAVPRSRPPMMPMSGPSSTQLSSRVPGEVLTVAVSDFQRVKAGDLLVQIDPADYQAQVAQAEAGVVGAQAALDNLNNQVELQYATIAQAEASRLSAEAQQTLAQQEEGVSSRCSQTDAGTRQRLEQATASYAEAEADVQASRAVIARAASSARGPARHQEAARRRLSTPPRRCSRPPSSSSAIPGSSRRSTASPASARCSPAITSTSAPIWSMSCRCRTSM